MRIRPILRISAVILLTLVALVCFALTTWDPLGGNACPPTEPERINDFVDLKFPVSTRNLWTNCKSIVGFIVQARFEMNPDDLDLLLQSTKIDQPLTSTDKPEALDFVDETVKDQTQQITNYLYGEYSGNDWWEQVLIDTSDASNLVVYYVVSAG